MGDDCINGKNCCTPIDDLKQNEDLPSVLYNDMQGSLYNEIANDLDYEELNDVQCDIQQNIPTDSYNEIPCDYNRDKQDSIYDELDSNYISSTNLNKTKPLRTIGDLKKNNESYSSPVR